MTSIQSLLGCALLLGVSVAQAAGEPAEVRARAAAAGRYLTDARGMSLYVYAQDSRPGKSVCVAECAKAWPPLLAAPGSAPNAALAADWTLIDREDGARQWAWRGKPLYTFAKDSYAGGMLGDGVGNAWHVALEKIALPPGVAIRSSYLGRILSDARGRTLYWRRDAKSVCEEKCLDTWVPLYAAWLARGTGDWSVLATRDGQKQWAFRGQALYLHSDDGKPGDTIGLEQDTEKAWSVAVLDGASALPAWVTIQNSDMGEVYADARGHTLYTFAGPLEKAKLLCDERCIQQNWQTIAATADTAPSGDWTAVSALNNAAGRVWAYKGNVLYTHSRDREPGAIGGDKWAAGVGGGGGGWGPLLRRRDFEN